MFANHRGGLIVLGVREEGETAVELTPVDIAGGEEARMRQIAASNLAPYVPFEIRVVPTADEATRGYYLLLIPPGPLKPHAVTDGERLRYPRRHGTTRRWLNEAEVADAYRDRFRLARDQTDKLGEIIEEALEPAEMEDEPWVVAGVAPSAMGRMEIDLARIKRIEEWAKRFQTNDIVDSFWPSPPVARAGLRRIRVLTIYDTESPPNYVYAELHADGSAVAARRVPHDPRQGMRPRVLNETLVWTVASCLRVIGTHAVENAGCFGDAIAEVRLVGPEMELCYATHGFLERAEGSTPMAGTITSRHTIVLDGLAGAPQDVLAAARLFLMDLFHAFGSPEVRQLAPSGALRIGYFAGQQELRQWAESRGVAIAEADGS